VASPHELASAYAQYLNAQAEIDKLEAAGQTSDPYYEQLVEERDSAYNYYVENGGGLESHHDAPKPASPGGRPTLRKGDHGDAVAELQRMLGIDDDGDFGRITETEVKDFQRDAGLKDDGAVGPKTWNALLNPYTPNPGQVDPAPSPSDDEHQVSSEDDNTLVIGGGVESVTWNTSLVFCSDNAPYTMTLSPVDQSLAVVVKIERRRDRFSLATQNLVAEQRTLSGRYRVLDLMPVSDGGVFLPSLAIDAVANLRRTVTPVRVQFVTFLPRTPYAKGRSHFELEISELRVVISSSIHFVKGWGGSVVRLGTDVPADTGGVIGAPFLWPGMRWMKTAGGVNQFWDGSAWQPLPATFRLQDANNFSVGFYRNGSKFTCQYGGDWPEQFVDWDLQAAPAQQKIKAWTQNIESTWTGKFDLKRKECASSEGNCCRHPVVASVEFRNEAAFKAGLLIIAAGNIRSNDSLFYLGEPRIAMAAHEFGHHMGNPDEYAGAVLDTSLNSDGATAGIDANSIMGQNLSTVKKRHFKSVCEHLASMVKAKYGVTFTYEAIPA
jgi:hypothetical protein